MYQVYTRYYLVIFSSRDAGQARPGQAVGVVAVQAMRGGTRFVGEGCPKYCFTQLLQRKVDINP